MQYFAFKVIFICKFLAYIRGTHEESDAMPKIASTPSTLELNIARKIASLRKETGMTLKTLGDASGLSEPYLSRIENGKTAITIANLAKLADAFAVAINTFFEADETITPITITRAGEGRKMRLRSRKGVQVRLLADKKIDKLMEPIWVNVSAASENPPVQSHTGQEFIYITKGSCHYRYGKQTFELNQGDCLYSNSDVNHAAVPIPGVECHAIAVVTSSDYRFRGDITRLMDE